MKLNQYQKKLMETLENNYPNIHQRITEVNEENGDLSYYGIEDVKDSKSMLECFDFILTDDLQDEIPSISEPEDLFNHMKFLGETSSTYLETRQDLARFSELVSTKKK